MFVIHIINPGFNWQGETRMYLTVGPGLRREKSGQRRWLI